MSGYETFNNMKPLISVCSSANVINVQGFIDELSVKFPNFNVQYFELPYNDIDHCTFEGEDVGIMILCHSINNKGLTIIDVMSALYDRFLPNSTKILGKERICVVAHDFPATKGLDDPDKYKEEMDTFQNRQPTAFKTSSLVMMGGKLEGPVELQESNWQQLEEFLERAVRPKPKGSWQLIRENLYKHRRIYCKRVVAFIIGFRVGLRFFSIYHARSHGQSYFAAEIVKSMSKQILCYSPTKYAEYFLFCYSSHGCLPVIVSSGNIDNFVHPVKQRNI